MDFGHALRACPMVTHCKMNFSIIIFQSLLDRCCILTSHMQFIYIYQICLFAIDFQEEDNHVESLNPQLLRMGSGLSR
jgi:hypothetical protein